MVMHPAPARQGSLEMSTNTPVSGHPQMHKGSEVRKGLEASRDAKVLVGGA